MTKSRSRQSVLALAAALAVGGWLMAGLSEIRGESSDRTPLKPVERAEGSDDGWIWSGSADSEASYRWADDHDARLGPTHSSVGAGYSWDDSLSVAFRVESKAEATH